MKIRLIDPDYMTSDRAKRSFSLALKTAAIFVAALWAVFALDMLLSLDLRQFGVRPGQPVGLVGVFAAPLLHGGLNHLSSNSVPLFVLLSGALFVYPNAAIRALPLIYVVSGALVWMFARPANHIGASGLLYGLLTFVFVSGILRRDMRSIALSMLVYFLYGSMVWGVLPLKAGVSWEYHLAGAVVGIACAFLWRRLDIPPLKKYDWEDEEDDYEDGIDEDNNPHH